MSFSFGSIDVRADSAISRLVAEFIDDLSNTVLVNRYKSINISKIHILLKNNFWGIFLNIEFAL